MHTGDISLFSALQEQATWCIENEVPFEVVPGVSSYSAACATLKQELTLPGVSQTVILTRMGGRTAGPSAEELRTMAVTGNTLVLFLSAEHIGEVARELIEWRGPATPVAVVQKASWPEEKVVRGSLGDIAEKAKAAGISKTAVIIVGEVLSARGEKSRLYDREFSHGYRKAK